MKIKVLFFAQLKDAFGRSERLMDVLAGQTAGDIVQALFEEAEALPLRGLPLLYAINEKFVDKDQKLQDEDTLALLPPMAGG